MRVMKSPSRPRLIAKDVQGQSAGQSDGRFKGLGEMNASRSSKSTTMDIKKRALLRVAIGEGERSGRRRNRQRADGLETGTPLPLHPRPRRVRERFGCIKIGECVDKRSLKTLIEQHPTCCFCGVRPTVTEEHVPSRQFFFDKLRPNQLVVPSCKPCNHSLVQANRS